MPLKLVAYDLAGTDGQYMELENTLRGFSLCQKVQASVWMVHTTLDAAALRDTLLPLVNDGDNLMVAEIADWATSGRTWQAASSRRQTAA